MREQFENLKMSPSCKCMKSFEDELSNYHNLSSSAGLASPDEGGITNFQIFNFQNYQIIKNMKAFKKFLLISLIVSYGSINALFSQLPGNLLWTSNNGKIVQKGQAVVTCHANTIVPVGDDYVLAIMDIRVLPSVFSSAVSTSSPSYQDVWAPNVYHHPNWRVEQLGNIYGLTIDDNANIYVIPTAIRGNGCYTGYGSLGGYNSVTPKNASSVNSGGVIYKIDAITGNPTVLCQLPQQYDETYSGGYCYSPGLLQIEFDKTHNQLFVSNREDGKIYRIGMDGSILSIFDPGVLDNGNPGPPSDAELPTALVVNSEGTKLYYAFNSRFVASPEQLTDLRSVDLNGSGDFVLANDVLHETITHINNVTFFSYLADMDISESGDQMLIGQRTVYGDPYLVNYNHYGQASLVNIDDFGHLTFDKTISVGQGAGHIAGQSGENYGGIAFGPTNVDPVTEQITGEDGIYWFASADILNPYGPHGVYAAPKANINSINTSGPNNNAYVVDYDGIYTEDSKGQGGDIDIYYFASPCTVSLTSTPSTCNISNNTYSISGSITFTDAPATGTLTVSIGSVTQTFNTPFTSPQAYTLTGLTSDGASHTVTAAFSEDAACTATQTYTAPVSCQCVISAITATPGACSTTNNTYTLIGQVTFTNAPAAGTLVISVTGGNSVTLNAPFTSPISYSIANLNADGVSHTVTATFSNNTLCASTQSYTAPVQCSTPCPPSSFNFCTGDMFTLTAPAGYSSYQWYTVVGATETPITGATSSIYVATMPGTYIYHATDSGGCPIELCCPVTLNDVRPLLSCTATVIPGCGQSNGSATVTATGGAGGYTYTWSTTPAQTTATATNLPAGTYTVTVSDSGGCSNTCSVVLAAPNSPTCVASVVTQPGCGLTNGSATTTPSGGNGVYTYKWSTTPQQTSQTATGLGAGLYTVTVTDGNMCTSTCTVTLTTPSGPTCSIAAVAQPSCANLTGGSATVTGAGGSGGYTYRWSTTPQQTAATATGLSGGTYTVTITDSNSCTSTCQIIMTTPTNCCNVNAVTIQNIECYDNATPALMTDNKLRASLLVTNSNASLTTYNVTVNGGTTITPTSGMYGIGTQFTLGPGTAGGGATFTVTITDSANPGCQNTVQLVDPGTCNPGTGVCPPVKCGTATIQVNGN